MAIDVRKRNNVRVFGKGKQPMLFAHGFGSDQSIWRYITPAFEDAFQIIVFDYVGCGGSDLSSYNTRRYATLEGYAKDVLEICQALQLQEVVFVGHSVSSMIGILAAKQEPELFKSMIMLGPSPCYITEPGYEGGFERQEIEELVATIGVGTEWAGKLAQVALGGAAKAELTSEIASLFCSMAPQVAQQFAKATLFADHRRDLQDHKVRTLVVQTSQDAIAPVSVGEYVRRSMQECTMVKLDAEGHFPQMNAPRETITAMWNHLYTSWPEGAIVDRVMQML